MVRASPPLPRLSHRPPLDWRCHHVVGALRLRPPIAQHTLAESRLLLEYAAGARTVVELGVAEGGSAAELRSVIHPEGSLFLVDPYEPGRLGLNFARVVARRTVGRVRRGAVHWERCLSGDAAGAWPGTPVDFLFIDADHSYARAREDWDLWSSLVPGGGHVALHDSAVFDGGWTTAESGPVRLVAEILGDPGWSLAASADSLTVLRRAEGALVDGGELFAGAGPGQR